MKGFELQSKSKRLIILLGDSRVVELSVIIKTETTYSSWDNEDQR